MATIFEPGRELPVSGNYDVIVVGGGIAGVSAALAASRAGSSVCILEKLTAMGGLATVGNVIIYLPLCDGMGHQISGGICEELLKLSVDEIDEDIPEVRQTSIPACWRPGGDPEARRKERYQAGFNPWTFICKLDRLLQKNKIKIYYDTRFCSVVRNEQNIEAVIIENKDGRSALTCGAVVDCSGDADVCWAAGEKTVSLNSNVCCGWYYYFDTDCNKLATLTRSPHHKGLRIPGQGRWFRGDKADDVTAMMIQSRKMMMDDLAIRSAQSRGPVYPVSAPSMPCFRMTRRLAGRRTLRESDVFRWYEDTVGMVSDWRKKGPVYSIPLSVLAAVRTGNLITAGRCISAAGDTWDITRVIPDCAVTGEAAGAAAAFLVQDQAPDFRSLDIAALQKYLCRKSVIIDKNLLRENMTA